MCKILAGIPFLIALCPSRAIPIHAPDIRNRLKLTATDKEYPSSRFMRLRQPQLRITANFLPTRINDHPRNPTFDRGALPLNTGQVTAAAIIRQHRKTPGSRATGGNYREEFAIPFQTFL